MKFIDEKGRIFGKINIIDFLVLVILVAAIAVVGLRFTKKETIKINEDSLELKFYTEEVSDFVADKVKKGVTLYDESDKINLGKVTKVERSEPQTWGLNSNGEYVKNGKGDCCSLIITGEVKGKKTEMGAEVGGARYGVGHTFVLRAGDAKIYLRVYDISVKEG